MNINTEFKLEMLESDDKEVIDSINSYFRENEMTYEVVKLYKKSNCKNDCSLYVVVAELANTKRHAVSAYDYHSCPRTHEQHATQKGCQQKGYLQQGRKRLDFTESTKKHH